MGALPAAQQSPRLLRPTCRLWTKRERHRPLRAPDAGSSPQQRGVRDLSSHDGPIGLALENFDAVGKWRTTDSDVPIDASTTLSTGEKVNGPVGLRQALLGRPEVFVGTLTENLMTYALGRGVEALTCRRFAQSSGTRPGTTTGCLADLRRHQERAVSDEGEADGRNPDGDRAIAPLER